MSSDANARPASALPSSRSREKHDSLFSENFCKYPAMRFQKDIIEASGGRWEEAQVINDALDTLTKQRIEELPLIRDLRRSKIVWKFATLRQCLTYRLVDLGDATIAQWSEENSLAAIILARSFLETTALIHSITERMKKALSLKDIRALDSLAMKESFGGKHPPRCLKSERNTEPRISIRATTLSALIFHCVSRTGEDAPATTSVM
jgi:hypothetical protein